MKNKWLLLTLFTVLLVGCSSDSSSLKRVKADVVPDLKLLLVAQKNNGYAKKTTISSEICAQKELFHAGVNTPQRATYYNQEETALLMGEYDGGFDSINSGYRNIDGGIQHFTYKKEGDYFLNIKDDWSYMGQSVGDYYPTLTSLSELINQDDWVYDNQAFTFIKSEEQSEEEIKLFKNFQFFAAPMILEGAIQLKEIDIQLVDDVLSIKVYNVDDILVSEALISKGY